MWYLYENGCKQCPCHHTVSPSISSSQINIRNLPSWSSIDQIIFSFPASFSANHISFYLSLWWPGHPGFFLLRYIYILKDQTVSIFFLIPQNMVFYFGSKLQVVCLSVKCWMLARSVIFSQFYFYSTSVWFMVFNDSRNWMNVRAVTVKHLPNMTIYIQVKFRD